MSVAADSEDLQVDSAGSGNGVFVFTAVVGKVFFGNAPVWDMDVFPGDIKMIEEVIMHEVPVTFLVIAGKSKVLVEIEGRDIGEGESVAVEADQFCIEADWRATGGKSKDDRLAGGSTGGNEFADFTRKSFGGRLGRGEKVGRGKTGHE